MPDKQKIRSLFDDIAPDYDKLNHLLSLNVDKFWRRRALREILDGAPGLNVLDIACGTCDFSIAIARKLREGKVVGLDLSEGMLEVGRTKIQEAGLEDKIELMVGDAESLPFEDGSFDRVTVAFGVRNFENLRRGLSEMRRVLSAEGKLVILELSVPQNRFLFALYKLYFTKILPLIGGAISGNKGAYNYLPASVIAFPKPAEFMRILEDCGYGRVTHHSLSFGLCRMYTGYSAR